MPERASRKYITKVDYIAGIVGGDVARDVIKVALAFQDSQAIPLKVQDERIPVSIQQDSSGAVYIILKGDNVGLAKTSDINSVITKLTSIDGKVATENTLSEIKSKTDKLTFDTENALHILLKDDAMAHFKVHDYTILSTEVYFIESGSYWAVNNLTNDGRLVDDGTLYVFGSLGGIGVVEGEGTIVLR